MSAPVGTELPDEFVQITDDTVAKRFIFALGILGDLTKDVTLADGGVAPNQDTMLVAFYDHPTHWILACRFHGNVIEKENGFVVIGWPRNKFPKSVVADFVSTMPLGDNVSGRTENFGDKTPPQS